MSISDKTQQAFKALILEHADFSNYDSVFSTPKTEKGIINTLSDIFNSEKGWEIKRSGGYQAASDWFQGLCSACPVPFYYEEIYEWYAANGLDTMDGDCDMSLGYYTTLGEVFCDMIGGKI